MPTARSDERPLDTLLPDPRQPSRRELLQAERREERRRVERHRSHPLRLGVTAVLALAALGAGVTWVGHSYFGDEQVIQTTGQHDGEGRGYARTVEVGIRFGVAAPVSADGVYVYVADAATSPVVRVWSSRGRLLSWGALRSGSAGWRKVPLRQAVPLAAGTSYVASATMAGSAAVAAPTAPPAAPGVTVTSVVSGWAGRLPSRSVSLTTAPVQIGLGGNATSPTPTPSTTKAEPTPSITPTPTTKPSPTQTSEPGGGTDPTGPGSATGCVAKPHSCGYPDATNTGVPSGTSLKSVPGDVSKGAGWHFDSRGWVAVDGSGAVLDGLAIPYNVDVTASNVTIKNSRITVRGESFGISVRRASNVTIANNEISGPDAGSGRLMVGIKDIYADSSNLQVLRNDIWHTSTGVQIDGGLIQGNFIHDMGYVSGDHLNGTTSNGGTTPLTIRGNTVLNQHNQTDAISLFQDFGRQANRTIEGNLLAGGGYTLYGGANPGAADTSNIKVTNNRFARSFYSKGGYYGPVTAFDRSDSGNIWSGNVWDDNGSAVNP